MDIFNEFLCFGSNWGFMFVSSVKPSSYVHKSMFKRKSISMNSNENGILIDLLRKATVA